MLSGHASDLRAESTRPGKRESQVSSLERRRRRKRGKEEEGKGKDEDPILIGLSNSSAGDLQLL